MPTSDLDKEQHYGEYLKGERWRGNLAKKMTHKALDIPEGEMIEANRTYNGIGTGGAVAVAAAAGLPTCLIAAFLLYLMMTKGQQAVPPAPPAATSPSGGPVDSEYDVIFYDADGNKIDIPHISTKPK